MARVRQIVASTTGGETARAEAALKEVERQRVAAKHELEQRSEERSALMRKALDGDVGVTALDRQEAAETEARSRLQHLEQLVRAASERLERARHNEAARDRAARFAKFRKHVDGIAEGLQKIRAGIELVVAGVKQVRAETHAGRQVGSDFIATTEWPVLLRPDRLEAAINAELVRLEGTNDVFRGFPYSMVVGLPTLEDQERAAVQCLLPPDPQPRPQAA